MAKRVPVAVAFKIPPEAEAMLREVPEIDLLEFPRATPGSRRPFKDDEMARALAAAPALEVVYGSGLIPTEILDAASNLKWVQLTAAGVDRLVDAGMLTRDFTVTTGSGLASDAIAEYVLGAMLALAKTLHVSIRDQAEHRWHFRFNSQLKGKTCGIIGFGHIGRDTARLARAFGMRVIATRRRVGAGQSDPDCDLILPFTEVRQVLAQSDYVVLSCPLTPETRGMIDAEGLAAMKPSAYLVNVARGPVVVESALLAALRDGTIAGAALDVFDEEPLPAESEFWDMPNVIVTPHISAVVDGYWERATELFIRNFRHYVAGEPLENVVDPALSY